MFRPAPENTGIVFVRSDLDTPKRVPARVEHRLDIPRRTSLCYDGVRVDMVEHVMAALGGLQIDNCEVWVNQPEMPGCDGSSQPFIEALDAVGIVEQEAPRWRYTVNRRVRIGGESSWVEAQPSKQGRFTIQACIDYGTGSPIGLQVFGIEITSCSFRQELATARTFLLEHEAEYLRSLGLGTRVTPKDLLVFNDAGPINNTLRFPDECVRHKLLDAIGDLTLAGCDLIGHFVTYCSGHRLNAELVQTLISECGAAQTASPLRQPA